MCFFKASVLEIFDAQSKKEVYDNGAEYQKKVIRLAKAVKQDASCQQKKVAAFGGQYII